MISADTTIEEMFKLGLISVRAMNVCRSGEIKTLIQLLKSDKLNILRIRNCGRKTLLELDEIRERYNYFSQELHINIEEKPVIVIEETELEDAQKKIEHLAPNTVVQLKGWISWKFNELNVRAKKVFPQLSQLVSVIDVIYSTQKFNALDAKNIGKKTSDEIQSYLSEVKAHFEEITKEIDLSANVPMYNEIDRIAAKINELYPFLQSIECDAVASHVLTNGIIPILFIAKHYILRSEDPRMSIYRDYYGFNTEGKRFCLSEIAERYNLSRERIRQLVSKRIMLPKSMEEYTLRYLSPLMENIIPFDSPLWSEIKKDNMLEESHIQTALLACSLTDTHTIIQIDDSDKEYLVNKSLIINVKIKNILTCLARAITSRRSIVERIDILDYIKDDKRSYHRDVEQLCTIYANYLSKNYEVDIEDNRYVMLLPNTIDISAAIENILEQSGEPMSLERIKQVFNTLYPAYVIDDATKFKQYIYRNPNVRPKGKTGIYVLNSWSNVFTGTLTDYIEHILHTFKEPIPLDDLVDFALDEFPKSNKKSIYSLIVGDKDERFIIYEDDYIGLADNPISEIEFKERRIIKRHNFENRFEELKLFVNSRKRLPIQNEDEVESSLARWIRNVLKGYTESSEEQLCSLKDFLTQNKSLPQNGSEYKFKQMCDEIKIMVTKTFSLPTASDNVREYNWLRKNLEKYTSYSDNRRSYFEELLNYIKDFGFYL